MKKIVTLLTHPIFISLLGLSLISLLVWFAGPHIKFGEDNSAPLLDTTNRLLCIMVFIVIWGLNNLRTQVQSRKQNDDLVSDIENNQAQSQSSVDSGVAAEEIHQMNKRFTQAIETLKTLKFKGRGKKRALYELPWYIIVGPPGSGKTTALVNSGLDFPLAEQFGKGALQGVGGTRNCDWWFTNDAVLIDTAGRYTTQDSHRVVDSSAWEGFLSLLKRNRRRRPINGVIVAISLHDLLIQTEAERIAHAKTIRTRLDELMLKLEIRFPIYLMFTKSDMVSGFTEFFEDMGREDRDQVWGVSLPNAAAVTQGPDFEFLSRELDALSSSLYERSLSRMHYERDVKRRVAINSFPQQMENIKCIADSFVRQTFIENRFRYQPYLRGVYFTSGTQDGAPIDRLMTSVASNFGFSREASQSSSQQGKSFFLARLFNDVIFPESELVGSNVRYELFIRWAQRFAYAGLAAVTLATLVIWSGSLTKHKLDMLEVSSFLDEYNVEHARVAAWNNDIRVVLPSLNALAKASIVYDKEEHPWLSGMGMYDSRVDDGANAAYTSQLRAEFLPRLLSTLETQLDQGPQSIDLYNTLRIYMMFNQINRMDTQLVSNWFHNYWDQQFYGEATRRQELKAHLSSVLALNIEPMELNDRIVRNTRQALLRVPVAQRIYERLKSDPNYSYKIDMRNQMGDSAANAFGSANDSQQFSIPALFTINAYKNIDLSASSPLIKDVVHERWLLTDGNKEKVDFIETDLDEISRDVKSKYLAEYTKVWLSLYRDINVNNFSSLQDASRNLNNFSDPVYSPLLSVLQVGKSHTELTPPILDDLQEQPGRGKMTSIAKFAASKLETTRVDKHFNDLHRLTRESKRGAAPISAALQRIKSLQVFIDEIAMSPDPGQKSFQVARARFLNSASNPITELKAYASSAPEPVNRWLTSLASESWRIVLQSAHQYVAAEWRARLYKPYSQALAGLYPLNSQSADDVAALDFSTYFKPSGTADAFYQEFISPFVTTRNGWKNRVVDQYSIGFSSSSLRQLKQALTIKNVFFQKGDEFPSIELELRPLSMQEKHARFTLDVGGNRVSYKHGPKFWKSVKWSAGDNNQRVRVIFEDLDDIMRDELFHGEWSWFRLMDASEIKKTNRSNIYQISFIVENKRPIITTKNEPDSIAKSIKAKLKKADDLLLAQNDTEAVDEEITDKNTIKSKPKKKGPTDDRIVYEGKAKSINNPFQRNLLASFKLTESI